MPSVVSNTTPIISLLKINHLDLLRQLYDHILIPQAVYREIEAGADRAYYTDLGALNWIRIKPIANPGARCFLFDLDDGEAETLVLAQERGASLVIIDEKCGRRYAQQMGIPVTGTLGVLLKAKQQGVIPALTPLLHELTVKQSWLSPALIAKARQLAGE
jgi:predicted nucleic acid-binding protein